MKKTELHPQIFLIENFLSDQECDHYIEMTKDKVFEEAKINMRGRQVMSKGIRNNDRLMIFDNNLAENLFQRAVDFFLRFMKMMKFRALMKCSGFINILRDSSLKCIMMGATSEMRMKKAFTLF